MSDEQAAATTDADPKDRAEDSGTQTLDEALAELTREPETQTKAEPEKPSDDRLSSLERELKELRESQVSQKVEEGLRKVIQDIRKNEDIAAVYDDEEVRALLEFRAAKEPRIVQAFVNRERNPQAWATVQKTLTRELADRASRKPDRNLTKGRQAAEAAARGISTTAPSTDSKVPPQSELSKMSDADFNKLIGELGA